MRVGTLLPLEGEGKGCSFHRFIWRFRVFQPPVKMFAGRKPVPHSGAAPPYLWMVAMRRIAARKRPA